MEDESKEYLVLNTHKGLHRLNRLAFGIASAPAIWQRAMDQLLHGIPDTHCIVDDILLLESTMSTISPASKKYRSDWKTPDFVPTAKNALSYSP